MGPIQSVKGKVVIDAFRTINPQMIMLGQEPRQTTSNLGHLQKPSIQALIHGLNRHYYSMPIVYRKNEHEQQMLMNLHKSKWQDSLTIGDFEKCKQQNIDSIKNMVKLAKNYKNYIDDESKMTFGGAERGAQRRKHRPMSVRHAVDDRVSID